MTCIKRDYHIGQELFEKFENMTKKNGRNGTRNENENRTALTNNNNNNDINDHWQWEHLELMSDLHTSTSLDLKQQQHKQQTTSQLLLYKQEQEEVQDQIILSRATLEKLNNKKLEQFTHGVCHSPFGASHRQRQAGAVYPTRLLPAATTTATTATRSKLNNRAAEFVTIYNDFTQPHKPKTFTLVTIKLSGPITEDNQRQYDAMKHNYNQQQTIDIVTTTATANESSLRVDKSIVTTNSNYNNIVLTTTNNASDDDCDSNNNKKECQIIPLNLLESSPPLIGRSTPADCTPASLSAQHISSSQEDPMRDNNRDNTGAANSQRRLAASSNSSNISVNINITIANHNSNSTKATKSTSATNESDTSNSSTTSINRQCSQSSLSTETSSTETASRKKEEKATTGGKGLVEAKVATIEEFNIVQNNSGKQELDRVTSMLSSQALATSFTLLPLSSPTNDNKNNDIIAHTTTKQQQQQNIDVINSHIMKQPDKDHDPRSSTMTGNQTIQTTKSIDFSISVSDQQKISVAQADLKATPTTIKNNILNSNMSASNQQTDKRSNVASAAPTTLNNNNSDVATLTSRSTTDINSENQQSNHDTNNNTNSNCDNNNREGQPKRLQLISQNNNSNNNNNYNNNNNNNSSSNNNITKNNGKCMIGNSNSNSGSCIGKQMTNSISNLVNSKSTTQPVITHKQNNNNNNSALGETTSRLMINRNSGLNLHQQQNSPVHLVRYRAHKKRRCRSSNGSSTGEEMSDCDLDGSDQLELSSSNDSNSISDDNEFKYGPGIVDRLKNKFLSMQQLHNSQRPNNFPTNGSHIHTNGCNSTISQQLGQHTQQRQNQRWFSSSVDSLIAAATATISGVPTHSNLRLASTKSVLSPSANSVRSTPTGTPSLSMVTKCGKGAAGIGANGVTKSHEVIILSCSHSTSNNTNNNCNSVTTHQQQQLNSGSKPENLPCTTTTNAKLVQPAKRQPIFKKQQHESSASTLLKSPYSMTSVGSSTAQGLLLRRQQHQQVQLNSNAPPSVAQSSCQVPDFKSEQLSSKETTNSKDDRQIVSKKNVPSSSVLATDDHQQQKLVADSIVDDNNTINSSNVSDGGGSLAEENCTSSSTELYQDSDKQQLASDAIVQTSQCTESSAPTACKRNDTVADIVVPSARSTLHNAVKSTSDELQNNVLLHKNIGLQQQQQFHNSIAKHPELQISARCYNKPLHNYTRFVSATSGSTVTKTIDRMAIIDDPSHLSKQQQQKKRENPPVLKSISNVVAEITAATTYTATTKQIINTNPSIDFNELPKPDIVKTCKRIFEPEQNAQTHRRSARADITNSIDQHYHQRKMPIASQYLTNNKRLCNDRILEPVPRSIVTNGTTPSTPHNLTGDSGADSNNRISSCHAQIAQTNLEPEYNSEKSDISTTSIKTAEKIEKESTFSTLVDKEDKEEKTNSSNSTNMIMKIPPITSDSSTLSTTLTSAQQPMSSINEFIVHHQEHNASSLISSSSSDTLNSHSLAFQLNPNTITTNSNNNQHTQLNSENKLEEQKNILPRNKTQVTSTVTDTTRPSQETTLSSTFQKKQDQITANNSQTGQLRTIVGKSSLWSAQTTYSPSKSQTILDQSLSSTTKSLSSHLNNTTNNYSCNGNNNNNNKDNKTNSFRPQVDGVTTTRTSSGGATTTTIVFDFRGKNVKPNVAVQPRMFGLLSPASSDRSTNGGHDNGYDNNNGYDSCHHDDGSIDFPIDDPRHNVTFEGDNVIIGNGSLLIKRNKQLKIQFDDKSTITFEYPSEASMSAELSSPTSVNSGPRLSSSVKLPGTPVATRTKQIYYYNTNAKNHSGLSADKSRDFDGLLDNKSMTLNIKKNNNSNSQILASQRRYAGTSAGKYAPAPSINATMPFEHNRNDSKNAPDPPKLVNHDPVELHNKNNYGRSEELPRLPVADLEQTMEKLKESLAPFAMNSHEYAETLNLIDEFQSSAGVKLSLLLNEKAKQTKNWMSHDWWQHETYLSCRSSLMINSNPAMIYPKLPDSLLAKRGSQKVNEFLARLIAAFMDCREALRTGTNLESASANTNKTAELCLDQYTRIFGSTRIPSTGVDNIHIKDVKQSLETFKVIITHKNKFYQLDLSNTMSPGVDATLLQQQRLDTIISALEIIEVNSSLSDDEQQNHQEVRSTQAAKPVGILTSLPRDDWAKVYPILNDEALEAINEAQFVLCLDSVKDERRIQSFLNDRTHQQVLGRHILHADNENIGNRWFDKTLQLIVVVDDKVERLLGAGINYEHTLSEAIPISKIIEYTFEKATSSMLEELSRRSALYNAKQINPLTQPKEIPTSKSDQLSSNGLSTIKQLSMFDMSDCADLDAKLHEAKQHFDISTSHFHLEVLNFTHYGKRAIKSWQSSPDSWIQVALSLAYYNLHGRLSPCYESVSLRKFAYGRTETMRSLTQEVAQFCIHPNYDRLRQAVAAHSYLSRAASNGQGLDRVLLGYKLAFNEVLSGQWKWGLNLDTDNICDSSQNHSSTMFDNTKIFSDDEVRVTKNLMNNKLIQRSKRFVLSTSQVNSIYPNTFLTYGPLVPEGYGCCYNPTNDQIVFAITADTSNPSLDCSPTKYKATLEESLLQMQDLLNQNYISNSKL